MSAWVTAALLILSLSGRAVSQTVLMHQMSSIQVVVPYPGLTITVSRQLNFGHMNAGSGKTEVPLDSTRTGKFSLTGLYHRLPIYMSVETPRVLTNGADSIKFVGRAAMNDKMDNPATSTPLKTSGGDLSPVKLDANREGWTGFAYIYLFGYLKVGKVESGVYNGTCVITLIM